MLQHDLLGSQPKNASFDFLELTGPQGERQTLRFEAKVHASQVTAMHALCVAGWGIGMAVSQEDAQALADGRLLPVLPGWVMPDVPVYAVTARRGDQPATVRHALDLLAGHFAKTPVATPGGPVSGT